VAQTHIREKVEGAVRASFGYGLLTAAAYYSGVRVESPLPESASDTTVSNTANVTATNWLSSIVGAFDNDPVYARIIENIKENRRRLAAEYAAENPEE
jgi:hypothetical protein